MERDEPPWRNGRICNLRSKSGSAATDIPLKVVMDEIADVIITLIFWQRNSELSIQARGQSAIGIQRG